jgi:hypothetical protein
MEYSSFLIISFKKVVQALDASQVDFADKLDRAYIERWKNELEVGL